MWFCFKICSQIYIQKKKKIWILQSKQKALGCSGSHHFPNWRQGFGKKLEMSGSARSVPSIIYTFWRWECSELHSSNRCHKFCMSNNEWSYVEGSLTWMQPLPSFWQMGIDLEDKTGSCCLRQFSFHLFPRPWRTKSQGLIGACRGWCPHRNADSEPNWKEAFNQGLESFDGLLKVIQLVEFSSPAGPGKQRGKLWNLLHHSPQPWFIVPFWAAVSSASSHILHFSQAWELNQVVCVDAPTTSRPFPALSLSLFPPSFGILRETESNSVPFEVKNLRDHSPWRPSVAWPPYHI